MEKIQENRCKQACSYVFIQENYIKAHVCLYFLHLVLTFTPHYIIMVKGLLGAAATCIISLTCMLSRGHGPREGGTPRPLVSVFENGCQEMARSAENEHKQGSEKAGVD